MTEQKQILTVGVGVSTFNRPKTLKLWLKQFHKHTENLPEGIEIAYHVQPFYPLKHSGIAAVKNDCLRALLKEDCQYIFLFDDDCFPIHDDWWMPFIEAHLRSAQAGAPQHHFLWLMDDTDKNQIGTGRKLMKTENGISIFRNAQGCCMFMTRPCVDAVGGFDEKFGYYGSEHENYSMRILKLGWNTMIGYLSVPGIEQYIYSLDVQGAAPFRSQLGNEVDFMGKLRSAGNFNRMRESAMKNEILLKQETQFQIPL